MDKTELKPCPFCGGEAEMLDGFTLKIPHAYFVRCKKCNTESDMYGTKRAAKKHWDRRTGNE